MTRAITQTEPRSWFSLFFAHYGWVSLIAAAFLFAMTLASAHQYRLASAFVDHGVKIAAEVTVKEVRRGNDRESYFMTFRYRPDGSSYAIKHKVSETYFNRHAEGAEVSIYYLPNQPHEIQTRAFEKHNDAVLFQVMAAASGIAGCGALLFSGGRANSAVRARKFGARLKAQITRIEVIKNKEGEDTSQRRLIWQEDGGRFGKSLPHHKRTLSGWSPGDTINIYRGPKRSWWDGDVGPRDAVPRVLPRVRAPQGE